jgi:hypothetical protein
MLLELLALAARASAGTQPTLSGLAITPSPGSCTGSTLTSPATVRLNWSVVSPNDAAYTVQVSVNGGTPTVLGSTSTTTFTLTKTGLSAFGEFSASSQTDAFEVRVVRTADAVVVQTLTGSYEDVYGTCGSTH